MATTENKFTIPAIGLMFKSADEAKAANEAMRFAISALATHADVYVRVAPEIRYDQHGFLSYTEFGASSPVGPKPSVTTVLSSEVSVLPLRPLAPPSAVHVMLDLETLGRRPGCPVLSIGAVVMNPGGVQDHFYVNLRTEEQVAAGLVVDPDTAEWWRQQSPEARAALEPDQLPPLVALVSFTAWLKTQSALDKIRIWGSGSDFDNTVLGAVYEAFGQPVPWKFYHNRCFRTLKTLFRDVAKPEFAGTKHNAVEDAANQAVHAVKILNEKNAWATV